jgi:hypothetical protein
MLCQYVGMFVVESQMCRTSRSRAWKWSSLWKRQVRARHEQRGYGKPQKLSHNLLRHTVACQHRFSLSKGLRSGCAPRCAKARPCSRFCTSLPITDVTASDIGRLLASSFSQRTPKLSPETTRLALTTVTQRPPTATDSMHRGLG